MASNIDTTKPADGVPAVKNDLRANLAAAKSEIEALQDMGTGVAEARTASYTYAVGDFPSEGPLFVLCTPPVGGMTLTFPAPASFGLSANRFKHLAVITGFNSNDDISITCADAAAVRSQPGTNGWFSGEAVVKLGLTLAGQNEATVSVFVETVGNRLMIVGPVRV